MLKSTRCSCRGLESVPSTHTAHTVTPAEGALMLSSGFQRHLHPCMCSNTQTHNLLFFKIEVIMAASLCRLQVPFPDSQVRKESVRLFLPHPHPSRPISGTAGLGLVWDFQTMGFHFHSLPHGLILSSEGLPSGGVSVFLEEQFLSQRLDPRQRKAFLRSLDLPPSLEESEAQRGGPCSEQLEDEGMSQTECWGWKTPASVYATLEAREMSLAWG